MPGDGRVRGTGRAGFRQRCGERDRDWERNRGLRRRRCRGLRERGRLNRPGLRERERKRRSPELPEEEQDGRDEPPEGRQRRRLGLDELERCLGVRFSFRSAAFLPGETRVRTGDGVGKEIEV